MRSAQISGSEGGQQAILYAPISSPPSPSPSPPPRVTALSATRLLRVRDSFCGNIAFVGTSDGEILFSSTRDQPRDINDNHYVW